MGHKDLRLGQIVQKLVFYNIAFSWLLPPDSFQFFFLLLLRDRENDLYCIYSINRPGRLLNFWTLTVGAYSRLGAY